MAILSKGCKPDNFELQNSLKVNFTNIKGLCLNFFDCKSFLESNYPDIMALSETNQDKSIDSGIFSVMGYLLLIRKDSITHIHGLAVYVKEGLSFARDLSLENSADSYLCFQLALLQSLSYFFFLCQSPSSSLCTVFDSISSNIDEVLIDVFKKVNTENKLCFVVGDFNLKLWRLKRKFRNSNDLQSNFGTWLHLITRPTRVTSKAVSLIDNIFTNFAFDTSLKLKKGIIENDVSDHFPVFFSLILHQKFMKKMKRL